MTLDSGRKVASGLVDQLLALPTLEQRSALLEAEGLFNPDGLERLLDAADRLVNNDPGKARRLAELCADCSDDADAPATEPRAKYIRAGTHGLNGVFDVRPTPREANLLAAMVYQNIGGCYEYMGRYDEALDAYAVAEEKYGALGMTERLGEILSNRGAILLYHGRGSEALAAHETASVIFEEAGLTFRRAQALGNTGETHLQLANYMRSLEVFEQARRLLEPLDAFHEKYFILRNTADTYLELNLYSEALAAYGKANDWLRDASLEHDRARTLWGMGSALIALSTFDEAERALAGAADKFAAAGNAPMLSGVMLEQASLLATRGDREAALDTAHRALEFASEQARPVEQVYAHLRLADLLLPDVERTESHLLAAQRLAYRLALPQLRYRLNERLGHLRRLQGRDEEARVLLEAAVDEIERLRGTVAQEAMRASFLRDKTTAYEDLLLLHLARGDEEGSRRAFAVAERAKSRALVDLLTGVIERAPTISGDPHLEEQLRELQADLNATYNRLLGVVDEVENEVPVSNLQERAVELEREIGRLRLQATAIPDPFADLGAFEDVALERLPTDVVMLTYHVVGDEIMAFVGAGDEIQVVRNLGSVAVVAELLQRLSMQWDRFRVGPEFVRQHMALLERSTREILSHLFIVLVAPVEALLEESVLSDGAGAPGKLVIVPHGLLHQIPFHALFDGEQYLLERFEISYAPSARIYSLCQQTPRVSDRALVMSVPDPLIPAVTKEARAVARHLPGAEVLSDGQATAQALQSASSGCCVLHLACHGLFRSDNPMFSSLKLHDGWLTAADVMQLDLAGALVTLSACESGRNEIFAGDELIGLTRAFLGVGASTLVVSLWVVQDDTTASLMEKYYERLRDGASPAEALRAAQLALKDAHPYYWAPFVLVGKR
jgi:tetratricopeptide (TPR) repeat protein